MIECVHKAEYFWLADLAELDTAENRTAWMKGTVEERATESLLAARAAYQVPGTEQHIKPGQKLSSAYEEANVPIARRRLCQAGLRLAMVLKSLLQHAEAQPGRSAPDAACGRDYPDP
jgi:hypothetical protein